MAIPIVTAPARATVCTICGVGDWGDALGQNVTSSAVGVGGRGEGGGFLPCSLHALVSIVLMFLEGRRGGCVQSRLDRFRGILVGKFPLFLTHADFRWQGWLLGWRSPRRALRLAPRTAPGPASGPASHAESVDCCEVLAAGDACGDAGEAQGLEGAGRSAGLVLPAVEDGVVVWERACGGAAGLLQATLSAVAALVAKPLAALLDRLASTSAAIAAGGTAAARPRRVRPPRVLAPNRPLPPLPQPLSSVLHPL
jgi:hypothetical protein